MKDLMGLPVKLVDYGKIEQISIDRFIELVLEMGTECLKGKKEETMNEERRRRELGLVPRVMKPGQQIQIGPEVMKHAVQRKCKCGCEFFIGAIQVSTISALISPVGQELTTQVPVLICLKCNEPLKLKEEAVDSSDPPQGESGVEELKPSSP